MKKVIINAYEEQAWDDVFKNLEKLGIFVNQLSFEPALMNAGFSQDIFEALQQCDTGPRILTSLRTDIQKGSISEERIEYLVNKIDAVGKGRVGQRLSANLLKLQSESKVIPNYIQKAFDHLIRALDISQKTNETEKLVDSEDET